MHWLPFGSNPPFISTIHLQHTHHSLVQDIVAYLALVGGSFGTVLIAPNTLQQLITNLH